MGTNIFVEGKVSPVDVKITLLESKGAGLYYFERFLKMLRYVDEISEDVMLNIWDLDVSRLQRRPSVKVIKKESPIEVILNTDPYWILSIGLAFILAYKPAKESILEFTQDLNFILKKIKGLSNREKELLEIGINLTQERISKNPELQSRIDYKCKIVHNWLKSEAIDTNIKIEISQTKENRELSDNKNWR